MDEWTKAFLLLYVRLTGKKKNTGWNIPGTVVKIKHTYVKGSRHRVHTIVELKLYKRVSVYHMLYFQWGTDLLVLRDNTISHNQP